MGSLMSERVAVVATIDPDANVTGTIASDWVDMTMFDQTMTIVLTGELGASAGVDVQMEQATDSSGTGAKDITGKTITELVKATNDDDQAVINVNAGDLDIAGDFTHIRALGTTATATSDWGLVIIGSRARRQPANDSDLASVVEIV